MPERRRNAGGALWNVVGALWNVVGALRAAASKPAPRSPHRSGVPPARHGGLARASALAAPLRSSGVRSDRAGKAGEARRKAGGALWNAGEARRKAGGAP